MKAEDAQALGGRRQNQSGGQGDIYNKKRKGFFCTWCDKPVSGKGTRNRWLRFVVDIRSLGFMGPKTTLKIYTGGYCCNDHLMADMMKQIEILPNNEP